MNNTDICNTAQDLLQSKIDKTFDILIGKEYVEVIFQHDSFMWRANIRLSDIKIESLECLKSLKQ